MEREREKSISDAPFMWTSADGKTEIHIERERGSKVLMMEWLTFHGAGSWGMSSWEHITRSLTLGSFD